MTQIEHLIICDILLHFGSLRYTILESICIIDVDVDHFLNYILGVPSIGKINPIFFWEHLIEPSIFAIYFYTLGVLGIQFWNQFVLSMLMWIITKTF